MQSGQDLNITNNISFVNEVSLILDVVQALSSLLHFLPLHIPAVRHSAVSANCRGAAKSTEPMQVFSPKK